MQTILESFAKLICLFSGDNMEMKVGFNPFLLCIDNEKVICDFVF